MEERVQFTALDVENTLEQDTERNGGRTQKEQEEDLKKIKKKQAMLDNIGVVVATVIMVVMALTIVLLKVKVP